MSDGLELTLKTSDIDFVNRLFENKGLKKGLTVEPVDGGKVTLLGIRNRPGIATAELVIGLLVGVNSSLIAQVLIDLLSDDDKNHIMITHTKKTIKKGDHETIIEEIRKVEKLS